MSIIDELKADIVALEARIVQIQTACSHPLASLSKKHKCGGENDDKYWTDLHCGLCDVRWTEEGSR